MAEFEKLEMEQIEKLSDARTVRNMQDRKIREYIRQLYS